MNVPPYIPEPIEIPGNVSEEPRSVCLAFVRKTSLLYSISVGLVIAVAWYPRQHYPLGASIGVFVGLLLVLSLIRGLEKGRPLDLKLSALCLPFLVVSVGDMARAMWSAGWPVWALPVGIAYCLAYNYLSGRDHSFVGEYFLAVLGSSVTIAFMAPQIRPERPMTGWALLANAAFLFYYVYDSAALLTRRRRGEELAAVADLYRDLLNCLTYSVRVYHHWRKYNIWSWPK